MSLLLIDDQGEIWDGQSRKLRQSFDSPFSGGEFSDYAVANLGFVALNVYGASCQVRLRPAVVSDRTYRALQGWLERTRNERIVLTWLDSDWQNELQRAGPACQRRLEDLMASARRAMPNDFLSRLVLPEELSRNSPLVEIVRQWPKPVVAVRSARPDAFARNRAWRPLRQGQVGPGHRSNCIPRIRRGALWRL